MKSKTPKETAKENAEVCALIYQKLTNYNIEIFKLKKQLNLDVFEICDNAKVNENHIRQVLGMPRTQTKRL
jgi:hypothetical protein